MNYFSNDDYISDESNSDNSKKKRRRNVREKKYYCTESNKRINRQRFNNFPEILNESKELDLSRDNLRDDLSEDLMMYNDNFEDNIENIENLNNEIERILIDIYNTHIKTDKSKIGLDITKYEKHISTISKNFDKHYNIFILQFLSGKIKELVQVNF